MNRESEIALGLDPNIPTETYLAEGIVATASLLNDFFANSKARKEKRKALTDAEIRYDRGNNNALKDAAKQKESNTDTRGKTEIYNAGMEYFKATQYELAVGEFNIYKTKYPHEVYGYYWSFRSLSFIDIDMKKGLAIPDVTVFIEVAELDKEKNKSILIVAYGYLAGSQAT